MVPRWADSKHPRRSLTHHVEDHVTAKDVAIKYRGMDPYSQVQEARLHLSCEILQTLERDPFKDSSERGRRSPRLISEHLLFGERFLCL
jgi:hypothetical protein